METEYREFKIYGYFYTQTHSISLRFGLKSVYLPHIIRRIIWITTNESNLYMATKRLA